MSAVEKTYAANLAIKEKISEALKAGYSLRMALEDVDMKLSDPRLQFMFEDAMKEACADISAGMTMAEAFGKRGLAVGEAKTLGRRYSDFAFAIRVARARYEQVRGGPGWGEENNGGIPGVAPNIPRTGRPSTYEPSRGNRICALIEAGEIVSEAARREFVTAATVLAWAKRFPDFGARYRAAIKSRSKRSYQKRASHSPRQLWGDELIDILLGEIAKGRSISDICTAEDMPSAQLVYKWARERADFAEEVEAARKRRNANESSNEP